MKGVVDASVPHGPLGGLGRKDETRAPTKLLGDCYAIASQCSGLIFAGNDGVIVNFQSVSSMPTRTDVIDFRK